MKAKIVLLGCLATALLIWLIFDWWQPHSLVFNAESSDAPIVRGLKPDTTWGGLTTFKVDTYFIGRPFEDLRREMRSTHWKEESGIYQSTFTADSSTAEYGYFRVSIVSPEFNFNGPERTCEVTVIRSSRSFPSVPTVDADHTPSPDVEFKSKLEGVLTRLRQDHSFSSPDRKFVEQTVGGEEVSGERTQYRRIDGILTLELAAEARLYVRDDVFALIEKNLDRADPGEVVGYLRCYEKALTLGSGPQEALAAEAVAHTKMPKPPEEIDPDERNFIVRALSLKSDRDAVLASHVMVPKHRLDKQSQAWLLGRVESRRIASAGDARLFWELVERVVTFRNRPRIKYVEPPKPRRTGPGRPTPSQFDKLLARGS